MLLTLVAFYILVILGNIETAFSQECVQRDEVEAGRDCERACQPDGTCRKQNRECVCDGLCGLSCLRKKCPPLTAPLNGDMAINSNVRTIGAEVSYSCNNGYVISGHANRVCQANKTWNGTQPICIESAAEASCQVMQLENGRLEYHDSDNMLSSVPRHGDYRLATCEDGYILQGISQTRCWESNWEEELPSCQRSQCRIPPCPTHGRWTISNSQQYNENCPNYRLVDSGTILTYRCNNGYFKCQQRDPVCQDLEWDSNVRSLCKPLGCNFVTPRDGRLQISYTVVGESQCVHERYHQRGTVIEYSCNIGYKIRDGDPSQATCNVTTWSPQQQPTCEEVTCPSIRIANGGVNYQQNGPFTSLRGHNAVARFFCRQGYMLDGRNSVVCDNGIWNDTIPRCMEEPCYVTYLYRYDLEVVYRVPPGSGVIDEELKPAGTSANFICTERGFEASQTKICQLGGWTGPDPECSRSNI